MRLCNYSGWWQWVTGQWSLPPSNTAAVLAQRTQTRSLFLWRIFGPSCSGFDFTMSSSKHCKKSIKIYNFAMTKTEKMGKYIVFYAHHITLQKVEVTETEVQKKFWSRYVWELRNVLYVVAASSRSVAVRKLQQTLVVDQLIWDPTSPCSASIA